MPHEHPDPITKVTPRALAVLALAGLVYVFAVLGRISPPVVALDIMGTLNLRPDDMSLMFSLTFIAYALTQPIAGFGADRIGPKRCLLAAAMLLGAGSIWFSYSQSFWPAAVARALVGLGAGFALVPAVRLAANWVPARHFSMASTCILAVSALANFLAGSPLARAAERFGWRWSFLFLGLAGLVLAGLVMAVIADRPRSDPSPSDRSDRPQGPPARPATTSPLSFGASAKLVLSHPMFWLLGLVYTGTDLLYETFTGLWAGPYLIEAHGLSVITAGDMLSTASLGLLVGGPLLVWWANRWGSYSKVLICVILGNIGITAFIIWGPSRAAPWMLYLLCLAAPLGMHATALLFSLGKGFFPENVTGTVIGFLNVTPFLSGALMQNVVGFILTRQQGDPLTESLSAHEHYARAFIPVLFWSILTCMAAIWLHRRGNCPGSNSAHASPDSDRASQAEGAIQG